MIEYITLRTVQAFIVVAFVMGMIGLGIEIYTGRLPL